MFGYILTTFQCCFFKYSCRIKDGDQSIKNRSASGEVENLHEVPSMNLSDVYSSEKFGHDLLQLIGKFMHVASMPTGKGLGLVVV
jgi:hypothetical protein